MERILSEKGREHILLNGFCYRLDRKLRNGKESWRYTENKCKGRIHGNGSLWEDITMHTHVPQPAASAMKQMVSNIRKRASASNDVPRRIIQGMQVSLPDEATVLLPKYTSLQQNVQRCRKRDGEPIPAPNNVSEIVLPDHLHVTHSGEPFLLYDPGVDDTNKMFIFFNWN